MEAQEFPEGVFGERFDGYGVTPESVGQSPENREEEAKSLSKSFLSRTFSLEISSPNLNKVINKVIAIAKKTLKSTWRRRLGLQYLVNKLLVPSQLKTKSVIGVSLKFFTTDTQFENADIYEIRTLKKTGETDSLSTYDEFLADVEGVNVVERKSLEGKEAMTHVMGSALLYNDGCEGRPKLEPLCIDGSKSDLKAYILYPPGWDEKDEGQRNRCVVFNNPNDMTVHENFFSGGVLADNSFLSRMSETSGCPVIIYDYAGTGLNDEAKSKGGSLTPKGLTNNGKDVIAHAVGMGFEKIDVAGVSLGGGVATCALSAYLEKPVEGKEVEFQLLNWDSFGMTGDVPLQMMLMGKAKRLSKKVGRWIGEKLLNVNLNATGAMKKLVDKKVPVTIVEGTSDWVIRGGAKMSSSLPEEYETENKVKVYRRSDTDEKVLEYDRDDLGGHLGWSQEQQDFIQVNMGYETSE